MPDHEDVIGLICVAFGKQSSLILPAWVKQDLRKDFMNAFEGLRRPNETEEQFEQRVGQHVLQFVERHQAGESDKLSFDDWIMQSLKSDWIQDAMVRLRRPGETDEQVKQRFERVGIQISNRNAT